MAVAGGGIVSYLGSNDGEMINIADIGLSL